MIILKTPAEIAVMAEASRVVAEALADIEGSGLCRVSVRMNWIALRRRRYGLRGAIPAFKGYRNYPKDSLCLGE